MKHLSLTHEEEKNITLLLQDVLENALAAENDDTAEKAQEALDTLHREHEKKDDRYTDIPNEPINQYLRKEISEQLHPQYTDYEIVFPVSIAINTSWRSRQVPTGKIYELVYTLRDKYYQPATRTFELIYQFEGIRG